MHRHLIQIKKIFGRLKKSYDDHQINLDILLKVSKVDLLNFRDFNEDEFEELMHLYSIIFRTIEKDSFDEFYFSNIETIKEKIKVILSRFDYKTQELLEAQLFDKNQSDNEDEMRSLDRTDDMLYYYYMLLRNLMHYVPELKLKTEVIFDYETEFPPNRKELIKEDSRRSEKVPTNFERIYALKRFCPELWKKLADANKETQKQVIHHVTGVNLEDSYKMSFGNRQKELKSEKVDKLIETVSKFINID
jgi:hypothetical protein